MKQIVVIHGGEYYDSYKEYLSGLRKKKLKFEKMITKRWKDTLGDKLGRGYQVVMPLMPNASNAKYLEWKIWFEKMIPFLEKEVVLLGHSLGGVFLVKYLSENKFPNKILATIIVAAPFEIDVKGGFKLKKNLDKLQEQSENLIFYHSLDDEVVPFSEFLEYKKLFSSAQFREYKKRGHFGQATFPEIVKEIRKIFNS